MGSGQPSWLYAWPPLLFARSGCVAWPTAGVKLHASVAIQRPPQSALGSRARCCTTRGCRHTTWAGLGSLAVALTLALAQALAQALALALALAPTPTLTLA